VFVDVIIAAGKHICQFCQIKMKRNCKLVYSVLQSAVTIYSRRYENYVNYVMFHDNNL